MESVIEKYGYAYRKITTRELAGDKFNTTLGLPLS